MKNKILIMLCSLFVWTGCKNKQEVPVIIAMPAEGLTAVGPYLTQDNKGNTVLCWTEQGQDSLYRLKYAVYDAGANKFAKSVTVLPSAGCNTAAESMGKIAFKSDGTVMAIFAKRFTKEKNPFAGAIYYCSSIDLGKTWTKAQFLHSDTVHSYGRSFFDVVNLKDGELAAVWLDGRFGKAIKGSALMFSRTYKGKGFAQDSCIDKGTCECCRTDLIKDKEGNIHLAYRSIQFPSPLSGKQVRDMVYKTSADNGKNFSESKPISNDNWQIEGCPHSGPSLAINDGTASVIWFTAGGGAGLYYASLEKGAKGFGGRQLITASGRHPQMITLTSGKSLMVCEETKEVEYHEMKMDHSKGGMSMSHGPAAHAKIVLRSLVKGKIEQTIALTDGNEADNHAVLANVGHNNLVAWVREHAGVSRIYYAKLNMEN
ncbi:sialidase family protein [Pedobacter sp. PWIIR3]